MTKGHRSLFEISFLLRSFALRDSHLLLQILEKMRCSSFASIQSSRACDFSSGTAGTVMRRKCFVSRASFRQGADAFQKLFFRYRIVRFDVIRSDTRPCSNKLADDSASHRPLRNCLCEINDCFAEARCPLLQIVNAFSAGFFANNQYFPVVPKRIVINARSVIFGLRHFFVIRHSCFVI